MKKIGLVGGLGPESTLDYYRGIINAFKANYENHGYPEINIASLDLRKFITLAEGDEWSKIVDLIAGRFEILRKSGCDFGAIASNTPHKVFPLIQKKTSLQLISIVEATCESAESLGLGKLALMGTKFTMGSDFYQAVFEPRGIQLMIPSPGEQKFIHEKIMSEIGFGIIEEDTKKRFLAINQRMMDAYKIEGLILGCTELPFIIKPEDLCIAYLDTAAIHISKIIEYCKK